MGDRRFLVAKANQPIVAECFGKPALARSSNRLLRLQEERIQPQSS